MFRFRASHGMGITLLILALVLGMGLPAGAQPAERPSPRVDARAADWLAQAAPEDVATFIVGLRDDGTQAQVDGARGIAAKLTRRTRVHDLLSKRAQSNETALQGFLRGQSLEQASSNLVAFKVFNGFSITANKRVIEALKKWDRVETIELEGTIQLIEPVAVAEASAGITAIEWNITKIGADRVWSELGINGTGAVVGGLDTGVRYTHQDLRDNYKCAGQSSHTACWKDAVNNQTTPYDDHNHGTHTMGTAVGANGIGVAPGAKWIACKALNSAGSGTTTDLLECGDFFLAPGGSSANAPDVIINSWGGSNGSSTWYQQTVRNWRNAGIFPEFSNGNSGPSCGTVGAPASYPESFGVGATDSSDVIASFSSRGPSPLGSILKPQVSAPGVSIRSAARSSDTAYTTMSGTSMAGPHVAGLVALLVQANPSLTIDQMASNIQTYALGISASACSSSGIPNNVYGYGRIRAYESVVNAGGGPGPTPTPTPTPTATPPPNTIFFDDFETNQGWTVNPSGTDTATTGQWERGDPEATSYSGAKQLGTTVSGVNDLVTGRLAGSSAGSYDIDGGVTSVRSPAISLTGGTSYNLSFSFYLAHYTNSSSADYFRVKIVTASGTTTVFEELGAANNDDAVWESRTISLNSFAGQTIQIQFEAADAGTASLVEAAVDDVRVTRQ